MNNILNNYIPDYNKLLLYGFILNNNTYIYKKKLNNKLYLKITLNNTLTINVYDKDFNEEYLPYKRKQSDGAYVNKIKDEVNTIVKDIIDNCFINDSMKNKVLNYVTNTYNASLDTPWKKSPEFITIKPKNNKKWFGLIMTISDKLLNLNNEEMVDVINIKCDPITINSLIDNKLFFPAYHMNKKYWLTILLDNQINEEIIYSLIDQSYGLIKEK